jgi:hypothetical protein
LVTYDNDMPTRHRADLLKRASTLAVIDSKANKRGLTREEYTREVVHRWAHRMANQAPGSRFRYRITPRSPIKL